MLPLLLMIGACLATFAFTLGLGLSLVAKLAGHRLIDAGPLPADQWSAALADE